MNNLLANFDSVDGDVIYEVPKLTNKTLDSPIFNLSSDTEITVLGNLRIWELTALYILTLVVLRKNRFILLVEFFITVFFFEFYAFYSFSILVSL